jgi:hypothetical protein
MSNTIPRTSFATRLIFLSRLYTEFMDRLERLKSILLVQEKRAIAYCELDR